MTMTWKISQSCRGLTYWFFFLSSTDQVLWPVNAGYCAGSRDDWHLLSYWDLKFLSLHYLSFPALKEVHGLGDHHSFSPQREYIAYERKCRNTCSIWLTTQSGRENFCAFLMKLGGWQSWCLFLTTCTLYFFVSFLIGLKQKIMLRNRC